jgi:hypothetical protein
MLPEPRSIMCGATSLQNHQLLLTLLSMIG